MRPSHIWYLIAAFWLFDAALTVVRRGWRAAWLQAAIAAMFLVLGFVYRRREARATLRRKQP